MRCFGRQRLDWVSVVLIALAIRVTYCAWYYRGPYPFADRYREYIITAQRLIERGSYVSPFETDANLANYSALMPPLYTCWIAGVFAVLGAETLPSRIILELANAIASALACGLAFKIAQRLGGIKAGWGAGLLCATHPALIGYTNYIWDTSFFMLAVMVSVWTSLRLSEQTFALVQYFGLGICLGIVALLNPAFTLTYPLLVLFPLKKQKFLRHRQALAAVALTILGWAAAIGPWTIRNYVRMDSVHYVRSGLMLEFWMGVSPESEHQGADAYRRHFPLKNPQVAEYVSRVGEKQYLEELGVKVRQAIGENPVRYAKLVAWRAVDFWLGTVLTHGGPEGRIVPATRHRKVLMALFSLEVLLVVFALLGARLRSPEDWWLIGILLMFCSIYLLTNVQVRFRVPIEPLVMVLLGVAIAGKGPLASDACIGSNEPARVLNA